MTNFPLIKLLYSLVENLLQVSIAYTKPPLLQMAFFVMVICLCLTIYLHTINIYYKSFKRDIISKEHALLNILLIIVHTLECHKQPIYAPSVIL
jgi:hypothetical protein